jgi:polysaccharide transporter, PST family
MPTRTKGETSIASASIYLSTSTEAISIFYWDKKFSHMANKFLNRVLKHPVAQNALSLFIVQIARYVLPLLTIPYLARVLEAEAWGLVIFAQASAQWLIVVLDYGFNLSATREIARYRDNPLHISEIVTSVIGAFCLLLLGSGLIVLAMSLYVPAFKQHLDYLLWAWLIAIAQGIAPLWYFQGIERMQPPAMLDLGVRTFASVATFVWIKTSDEGWKVLALQAVSSLFAAGVMLMWMYSQIPWRFPRLASAFTALRMGWSMFLFQNSASLYTTANTFILGLVVPAKQVAFYGAAERLSKTPLSLMTPLSQTLFPRMSYLLANNSKQAAKLASISMLVMGVGGLVIAGFLALTAPTVVHILLGAKFEPAIPLLRVLVLLIPLLALSNVLGIQWMVPLGLDRAFNTIIMIAGLINLGLALTFTQRFGSMGMAWTVVLSETFVTLGMYAVLWHNGLGIHQLGNIETTEEV